MFGLLLFVLLAIGLGVCALFGVMLWRAGRWGIAVVAVLVLVFGAVAYRLLFPDLDAYRTRFTRESAVPFPASGEFVQHATSHGDVDCSAAIVAISPEDAARLRRYLESRDAEVGNSPRRSCGDLFIGFGEPYLADGYDSKDGRSFWWGLAEDEQTFSFLYREM